MKKTILSILFCALAAFSISAQTTAFTYQGSLKDGANPANGSYDLEFKLFDAVSAGAQQGSTLQRLNVAVANGIFTVTLDFGAGTLPGADRFLDIGVRTAGGGAFTALTPRQKVNSSPYSVKSLNSSNADTATNATQLGGVAASQYVVTTDPRMTNARPPTAGSTNYIQNQDAVPQPSSNFNISGTGTANFVNAATQFNLNNSRILGAPSNNLFVGFQTGQSNTTGLSNSFFGFSAGLNNTTGGNNSFFGYLAGNSTNTGNGNAFFGYQAGRSNTTGGVNSYFGFNAGEFSTTANYNSFFGFNAGNKTTSEGNSFFGASSGQNNTTGGGNSFLGFNSGLNNTTGAENAFFGAASGQFNTIGNQNSFFGYAAGYQNTGYENSFFGRQAGASNTTGFQNSFFGRNAGFSNTTGNNNSFYGTAAGEFNTSGVQNSFFGGFAGEFNTTGSANSFFGFVAGFQNTTGDRNSIFGFDAGRLNQTGVDNSLFGHSAGRNTTGSNNAFFGSAAGTLNAAGNSNAFFGRNAGVSNTSGNENSFFGAAAGSFNTTGIRNTAIGFNANFGVGNLQYATAIGAESTVSTSNTIALGRSDGSDQVVVPGNLVANLPAGDADYIQNRTTPQSANFSISGNGFIAGNLGIGTTNPTSKLTLQTPINSYGLLHTDGAVTMGTFVGGGAGGGWLGTTTNHPLHFFANNSNPVMTVTGSGSLGIGTTAPQSKLEVFTPTSSYGFSHSDGATRLSSYVGPGAYGTGGSLGTTTDSPLYFFTNNTNKFSILANGNADLQGNLTVNGAIQLAFITSGATAICRTAFNVIASCSSSLRYKTNIRGFSAGLSFVNQLRPISYDWKEGGMKDTGFAAEEVEKIDPRFVTYNDKGEVEGVKYDRLSVAFVNAFKEQQEQIEAQEKKIEMQQNEISDRKMVEINLQSQIDDLKKIVCSLKPNAEVCKQEEK